MPQVPEQLIEKYKEELEECKVELDSFGEMDDEQEKIHSEYLIKKDILEKHIEVLEVMKVFYDNLTDHILKYHTKSNKLSTFDTDTKKKEK